MSIENRVMNPTIARQLYEKSEKLKRQRMGKPAAIESFPRVVKTLCGLWGYREGQKYLEELILVEGGKHRKGFPPEAQEELMFLYQLLLDQHRLIARPGQRMYAHRPPGTKFTMGG